MHFLACAAVGNLADRVSVMGSTHTVGSLTAGVYAKIKTLKTTCKYAKNCLRWDNLFFCGVRDAERKICAMSENLVTDMCHHKPGLSFQSGDIVQAHHLGCFNSSKNVPS